MGDHQGPLLLLIVIHILYLIRSIGCLLVMRPPSREGPLVDWAKRTSETLGVYYSTVDIYDRREGTRLDDSCGQHTYMDCTYLQSKAPFSDM